MPKERIKNLGFIDVQPEPEAWIFGGKTGLPKQKILVPDGNWTPYMPSGEHQKDPDGGPDTLGCTGFGNSNGIEFIMNLYLAHDMLGPETRMFASEYLDENNKFNCNDRFTIVKSGTDPYKGNSMIAPADSIRDDGVIPWNMWKYEPLYDSRKLVRKDFYQQPPRDAVLFGKKWKEYFLVNREIVWFSFKNWLAANLYSPIVVGVKAWTRTKNRIYQRSNARQNHVCCQYNKQNRSYWEVIDHYRVNDQWTKKLAHNFNFTRYGIKYTITPLKEPLNFNKKASMRLIKVGKNPPVYLEDADKILKPIKDMAALTGVFGNNAAKEIEIVSQDYVKKASKGALIGIKELNI